MNTSDAYPVSLFALYALVGSPLLTLSFFRTSRTSEWHARSQPRKPLLLTYSLPEDADTPCYYQCCFQTYSYGRHFLSSCVRVCGYEALEGGIGVDANGSVTSVAYCPIGIDAERTERDLAKPAILPKIEALQQLYKGKKIIVGRDKLDWTKGVLPKVSL